MDKYFKIGGVVILITICLGVWWKIDSTISDLKTTIVNKDKVIKDITDANTTLKLKLALEEGNVRELKEKLDKLNFDMTKLDTEHDKAVKELEVWKNKPTEVKYVESIKKIFTNKEYDTESCDEGKKLNLEISKLKYEDL